MKVTVVGLICDVSFHQAKCCAEDLHIKNPVLFEPPEIQGMLEFEWDLYIEEKKKELTGETWVFTDKTITFVNGELVGSSNDLIAWAEKEQNYDNFRPIPLYETLAEEAYVYHLNGKKHDYVYLDVSINGAPSGRLLIELFNDIAPKTCRNFRALCTGEGGESGHSEHRLHYRGSVIHRVIRGGWIQGGDIWMKRGDGGESIFGPLFEDENFAVKHDRRGIVGMANKGRHTNASQFYITLAPAAWMDTQYVAFGRVVEGADTLAAIERVDCMNQRPLRDVTIADCGTKTFTF